jgi:hypothetical protein
MPKFKVGDEVYFKYQVEGSGTVMRVIEPAWGEPEYLIGSGFGEPWHPWSRRNRDFDCQVVPVPESNVFAMD